MKLTLNGIPPSLNAFAGRTNSWAYRNEKAKWTQMVTLIARSQAPKMPYQHATVIITYYFPTNNRHDADNYAGKFLLDGLTKAGVIVDDDLRHIVTVIKGAVDKERPRTEIEVIEDEA